MLLNSGQRASARRVAKAARASEGPLNGFQGQVSGFGVNNRAKAAVGGSASCSAAEP